MIWAKGKTMKNITLPASNMWAGSGVNPVAMMRTSWSDSNAIYLGFKCGTPSASHGHMDVGSFVLDVDGERWASDFGMQDYYSLEAAGIALWGRTQNSQRWQVFRYNNLAHNTLAFDNQFQLVNGAAALTNVSKQDDFMNATTNLGSIYKNRVSAAERGVAIIDKKYVLIRDEIQGGSAETTMRWNMLTTAIPSINTANSTITLKKGSKKVVLKVASLTPITMKTWTTFSPNSYDATNPGTIFVGFETNIPAGEKVEFNVFLTPERNLNDINYTVLPIAKWPRD